MAERIAGRWPTTQPPLLGRLSRGEDSEAWERFTAQYRDVLIHYGLRRGLQYADAEDIAQKVLVDVTRQMQGFVYRQDRGRFRSWLATIANRAIWRLNQRRACRGEVSLESVAEMEHPSDRRWISDFNEAVLEVALKRISPEFTKEEWRAFELSRFGDRRASEIAAELQRQVGWVYQLRYRLTQRLQQEIAIVKQELDGPNH